MAAGRAWREPVEGICHLAKLYLADTDLHPHKIGRLPARLCKSARIERASNYPRTVRRYVSTICIIGCREKTNLCRLRSMRELHQYRT
jgi:hypothetical protein